MLKLVIVKNFKEIKQIRQKLKAFKVSRFDKDLYGFFTWRASVAFQHTFPYKKGSLNACNYCPIYLLPFKLSTFTNFSMLFPVIVFSFVFSENLKSHVTGDTSSLTTEGHWE